MTAKTVASALTIGRRSVEERKKERRIYFFSVYVIGYTIRTLSLIYIYIYI